LSGTKTTAGVVTKTELSELQANLTRDRLVELELNPVKGQFDVRHLQEVHRRIFQDFPANGLYDVAPGQFRPPVQSGDWMKNRGLETAAGNFYVAYSRMDEPALARLDAVLAQAKPDRLASLTQGQFVEAVTTIYSELDYIHPFADGNSRTLRTFSKQLAGASGFELDWARFNQSSATRDALNIGRDNAVNDIALRAGVSEANRLRVMSSLDRLGSNADLQRLIEGSVRRLAPEMERNEAKAIMAPSVSGDGTRPTPERTPTQEQSKGRDRGIER
jgi:cell filamentation protein